MSRETHALRLQDIKYRGTANCVLMLSSSPTRILDDILIDIPALRSQAMTRIEPRFAELRTRIYRGSRKLSRRLVRPASRSSVRANGAGKRLFQSDKTDWQKIGVLFRVAKEQAA
jgi:hypothetical protein